jgi:signal transduction histidine kinase
LTVRNLPGKFVCDPHLLQIVLSNLLANAHRHSPAEAIIELDAVGDEHGGLLVAVTDHGEGIAPDEIPRLFQKYFRGRSALGQPGAGLGLFMVQRIVGLHGGRILVKSMPGTGSSFEIRLPAISPH